MAAPVWRRAAPAVTEPAPPPEPPPAPDTTLAPPVVAVPHATARPVALRRPAAPAPVRRPGDDSLFTIEIPRIGLAAKVHEGQSLAVLARGPGHQVGSAMPGEVGNVVIPGHRTVGPRPFYDIDKLQNGDEIVLVGDGQSFTYVVTGTAIVSPDDSWVGAPTSDPTVTIYACHPKGSDAQRYVVFGRLVSAPSSAPPPSSPPPAQQSRPPPGQQSSPPPETDSSAPPPSCGFVPCVHR
ncbi:MAG: class E sortase [Acidimicrobiia bacterium]|nr:class E sortase [Acidimicrobiia bacterium]